jgi:hypothetical protein
VYEAIVVRRLGNKRELTSAQWTRIGRTVGAPTDFDDQRQLVLG